MVSLRRSVEAAFCLLRPVGVLSATLSPSRKYRVANSLPQVKWEKQIFEKNFGGGSELAIYCMGQKKGPPSLEGLKKAAVYAKSVPKLKKNAMQKVDQSEEKIQLARTRPKLRKISMQKAYQSYMTSDMQKVGQNQKVGLCKDVTGPENSAVDAE